jgi:hypothetical protein
MNQIQKLQLLMDLRRVSLSDVAKAIGTTKQNLDYMRAVGRITKDEWLEKIADYFGVVPESLRNDAIDLVRRPDAATGLETLTTVIRVVEAYLLKRGLELKPDPKARLITLVYDAALLVRARDAQAVTRLTTELVKQKTGS